MESDTKKIIVLGITALVLIIGIFIFAFGQLFGDKETTNEEVIAPFPENTYRDDVAEIPVTDQVVTTLPLVSSTSDSSLTNLENIPEVLQGGEEADWRDDVFSLIDEQTQATNENSGSVSVTPTNPSIETNDLQIDYDYSSYYPTYVSLPNGEQILLEDAQDQEKFLEAVNPIPVLTELFSTVESCGRLKMPSSERAIDDFFDKLETYDEVICLGEATIADCEPAWTEVITPEGITMWVYVAEREDGVCGFGNTYKQDYVSLCDLEAALNETVNNDVSLTEWFLEYQDEPGALFARLYNSANSFTGASNMDCIKHQI